MTTSAARPPLPCLALVGLLASPAAWPAAATTLQVIPAPASVEMRRGHFRLDDGVVVHAADAAAEPVARRLSALLWDTRGIRTEVSRTRGEIRLEVRALAAASREAYALEVSAAGVTIRADDPRGLFYGAVTLWQLATADGARSGPAEIPGIRIEDAPRFAWRGLMLDSARHYQPPAFIRQLVDWMALHKLNVLHWHLTDDQGWRLEIRKYPRLTQVGAFRFPASADALDDADRAAAQRPAYGGFYTQDEVRDLVAYAAARFVTIVPEIEMPGHAQAAIASYPELGTGGSPPPVSPDWGVHDYLFNVDEATLAFLEDVLAEVIALFPGEYVHVGGDEAVKDRWRASPRVQARIRELGLADEAALQGWFVARIGRFLEEHGRRLVGWDEILEGGVPAGATVMSWRGDEGAISAARAGHDVVMAPSPALYLDHLQGDSPDEPPGRPSVESLEDVYAFEPVPAGLSAEEARHILGAQVNAWTEHMRLPERVEHQAFPRVAALAEATWSPVSARDWPRFEARLGAQFARYRALGIHYADSAFEPRLSLAPSAQRQQALVTLAKQAQAGIIRYTLDGSEPTPDSPSYAGAFNAALGTALAAATFDGKWLLGGPVKTTVQSSAWRRRTHADLVQCSGNLVLRLEDDAPPDGEREVFNVDIVDPCWRWPDADLSQDTTLHVAVGQLPFNFQIGKDAHSIRRGDARTPAGELELRPGDCRGVPLVVLPLAGAARNPGVTVLGPAWISAQPPGSGLCLRFARPGIDPIWVIDWVELGGASSD